MKFGFTGTQDGMTMKQCLSVITLLNDLLGQTDAWNVEFHIGDCIGSDKEFYHLVDGRGRRIGHPPDRNAKRAFLHYDESRRPMPYLDRNGNIAKEGLNGLIATPKEMEEVLRSGTWSTVRRARTLRRNIYLVLRDGAIVRELL